MAIPGVKETLQRLAELGKNLYYVSNNGVRSFELYQKNFADLGIDINQVSATQLRDSCS